MKAAQEYNANAPIDPDEGDAIEENWTFIGDESDPELKRQIQEWEPPSRGRAPRVSLDRVGTGGRSMLDIEPVRKASVKK